MTVCRHLNLGYASKAVTHKNFSETDLKIIMSGVKCRVDETSLYYCQHDEWKNTTCSSDDKVAGVICVSGKLFSAFANLGTKFGKCLTCLLFLHPLGAKISKEAMATKTVPTHSLFQVQANLLELNSQGQYPSSKREITFHLRLFAASIKKLSIVVQKRQSNVQKSVMYVLC